MLTISSDAQRDALLRVVDGFATHLHTDSTNHPSDLDLQLLGGLGGVFVNLNLNKAP